MMPRPRGHGWGWYPPQTTSYIIGILCQGPMVAPVCHYTGQVGPRFGNLGSLVEWTWCHNVMAETDIHLRPLHTSKKTNTKCLCHWYAVSRSYGCTRIPLHQSSWPQIWKFRVPCGVKMMPKCHGWGWYPPQTASNIHIRHIKSVWAIGMLVLERRRDRGGMCGEDIFMLFVTANGAIVCWNRERGRAQALGGRRLVGQHINQPKVGVCSRKDIGEGAQPWGNVWGRCGAIIWLLNWLAKINKRNKYVVA